VVVGQREQLAHVGHAQGGGAVLSRGAGRRRARELRGVLRMTLEAQLRAFARNRTAVIGSGAGVVLVFLAWRQLRAQQAPIVIASPSSGSAVDTGATADPLAAFSAGASAAASGYGSGVALGQSALGLAGSVVSDLGSVAGTLASSQADMGSTLSSSLSDAIGALTTPTQAPPITVTITNPGLPVTPTPTPSPTPTPTPTPSPTPTPTPTPSPSPSTANRWTLVFRSATPVYGSKGSTSPVGTIYSMTATATQTLYGGAWWYQLVSARQYQGKWVRATGTFSATRA
jgi:hypothetical protein